MNFQILNRLHARLNSNLFSLNFAFNSYCFRIHYMHLVDSLGMCGNIRYRGINLSYFQCPLQLRCLIYEEMLNSSICIVVLVFVGANLKNVIIFL